MIKSGNDISHDVVITSLFNRIYPTFENMEESYFHIHRHVKIFLVKVHYVLQYSLSEPPNISRQETMS